MISSFRCIDSMPCCSCGKESMTGINITLDDLGFTNYMCRQCLANLACVAAQALVDNFTIDTLDNPVIEKRDGKNEQN